MPRDTPLPVAARRVAEAAATRAVADVVAVTLHLAVAQAVVVLAVAGAHSDPVKLTRGQGPWNAKHPLLLAIARAETWCEAFALALAATREELLAALGEIVAVAPTCEAHAQGEMARERMLGAAPRARAHLPLARIADILDYEAFFRAAPRVVSLRALNDLGGIAMETGNSMARPRRPGPRGRDRRAREALAARVPAGGAAAVIDFPVEHRKVDEMCEAECLDGAA